MSRRHSGSWDYHDDDCMCPMGGRYCNRDGHVWSCCGACEQDTECTAPKMHPTYWDHPKYWQCRGKSKAEIRRIAPEAFG